MIRHSQPLDAVKKSYDDARRTHLRREQHSVRSNLGQVENLSERGMCVLSDCAPEAGRKISIELTAIDHAVSISGRVVWTKRIGQFRVASGVRFENVTPQQQRMIEMMARQNDRSKHHRPLRKAG